MGGSKCAAGSWRYSDFEKSFLTFSKEIDLLSLSKESAKQREYVATLDSIAASESKKNSLIAEMGRLIATAAYLQEPSAQSNLASKIDGTQQKIDVENNILIALNEKVSASGVNEEISDVEHAELVDLFQSSTESLGIDRRQKLQMKIVAIVHSLLLAPNGLQNSNSANNSMSLNITSTEPDAWVSGKWLIAEMQRVTLSSIPFFDVKFLGGIERRVGVDIEDPEKLLLLIDDNAASIGLSAKAISDISTESIVVRGEPEELKLSMIVKK